jgi:Dolichyl-phosphate-mannose-protein mannosyltransferase
MMTTVAVSPDISSEASERRTVTSVAGTFAVAAFLLQMLTNGRYGYFRDELYYIACSNHLAFGYVDFAPLAAVLLRISRTVFGDSLHALRLVPALAYAASVFLTGLIARELGGRRFAVALACGAWMLTPVVVANANRYSMNPIEPLFWMGTVYVLILAWRREKPQLLPWCGVLLGLGMENKHSTVFFIGALVVGLLLMPERKIFRSKYFWIAVALAAVIAMPNFVWQVKHGFPTWVDLNNVRLKHKNVELPPLEFMAQQVMTNNPAYCVIWIAGLVWLFASKNARRFRALGFTFLVFFVFMMKMHAKDYYVTPIYPMLYAAGGVAWERASVRRLRWLRVALALVVVFGVITLPIVLPILPVEKVVPYREMLGLKMEKSEVAQSGPLPQYFGDEFGWEEMVKAVAGVYNAMPEEQRAKTAILAGNYGEAGAIDFFGGKYGLPKSISAHQNYYYWGPRGYTGENLILLQWSRRGAERWCNSVEEGPTLDPQWGMAEEHYTVWICHGFKKPLGEVWDDLKHWN